MSISGQGELYMRAGSTVSLRCIIHNCLHLPDFLFWFLSTAYHHFIFWPAYLKNKKTSKPPRYASSKLCPPSDRVSRVQAYMLDLNGGGEKLSGYLQVQRGGAAARLWCWQVSFSHWWKWWKWWQFMTAQLQKVFLPPGTDFLRRNFPNIEEEFS